MSVEQSSQLSNVLGAEEEKLLACVHCGLCLEACPTYVHTGDENDSPRGRIYLMRAVEEGRLAPEADAFRQHLNRCLGCRACEQACPAGVQYGQLLEAGRAELSRKQRGFSSRLLHLLLRHIWLHPRRLRFALASTRLLRDMRLPKLLIKTHLAKLISPRLEFALLLLDSSSPSLQDQSGEALSNEEANGCVISGQEQSQLQLFTGCVTEGLFGRVNRATQRVLAVQGCQTSVPEAQVCCGALHAHAGDLEGARKLARINIEAFASQQDAPIVTNAGGCGAMLKSYAHLLENDAEFAERAQRFSARIRDISQQLSAAGIRIGTSLGSTLTTYDASCHLLYGQHAGVEPLEMLRAIPRLNLVPLEGSEVCCGGAGIYNLLEPEMSRRVLYEKLQHIKETRAELLATGNPGCHMQISAGAHLLGLPLRVCHPVELLDESYRRAGFYQNDQK